MIEKFKLQDYIGLEEYESLLYFNPGDIPEEIAMLKPVRRAVLAMVADIPLKQRKSTLQETFDDKQEQELRDSERRKSHSAMRKQSHNKTEDSETVLAFSRVIIEASIMNQKIQIIASDCS